jgi:hypothetical protein
MVRAEWHVYIAWDVWVRHVTGGAAMSSDIQSRSVRVPASQCSIQRRPLSKSVDDEEHNVFQDVIRIQHDAFTMWWHVHIVDADGGRVDVAKLVRLDVPAPSLNAHHTTEQGVDVIQVKDLSTLQRSTTYTSPDDGTAWSLHAWSV